MRNRVQGINSYARREILSPHVFKEVSQVVQERINRYWSQRAEEFSGLRMKEYEGVMRHNYKNIISGCLPLTANGRALDLGTGAGFFSLLLSELGWNVTAIDYSDEMLMNAKGNAENCGFREISFLRMDAQKLSFPDEFFSLIVSRNVTWSLPAPEKAYAEMVRVLQPGGAILNFDANYARAFKEIEERGEKPQHPTQTQAQLRERNEIAYSLSIAREKRPLWDVELLARLGLQRFEIDLDVDRRVCAGSTKEDVYRGIPKNDTGKLFMICARKAEV